jgi:cyclopropane-fatty-acyl-phospholipid synthase
MSAQDPKSLPPVADRAQQLVRADRDFFTASGLLGRLAVAGRTQVISTLDAQLREGTLIVTFPDGSVRRLGGHAPGPTANVTLHRWLPIGRFLLGGTIGWARGYINGEWTSPDLAALAELFTLNRYALGNSHRGNWISRAMNGLAHAWRENSKAGSAKNISFHYDLGNDFYKAWLDPSMTYSSALFADGDNSLEAAQRRKYRNLLDMIGAQPGDHILEIGCGWGGFAETAAIERGCKVTGITLSQEQLNFARQRIQQAGLADRVSFELRDYRDVAGRYDKIASIEMFEAVGEKFWQPYMDKVREVLAPGGQAGIQVITIDDGMFDAYRRSADFIQTYIFPGGMLPSVPRFRKAAEDAGLNWGQTHFFGKHYAQTLNAWGKAFHQAFESRHLPAGFDETFRRIWHYYLTYCEGGFRAGGIDVMQVSLIKPA